MNKIRVYWKKFNCNMEACEVVCDDSGLEFISELLLRLADSGRYEYGGLFLFSTDTFADDLF